MFKQLVDYFIEVFLMHKAVRHAKYQKRIYTNAQNNNAYCQAVINSDVYFELLKTAANQPLSVTVNVDLLCFPNEKLSVLEGQSLALQIGIEFLTYIKNDDRFMGVISLEDYSFLALEDYTDDKSCGQRLTMQFIMVDPIDLCTYGDNFSEDNIPVIEKDDLDLEGDKISFEDNELDLKPLLIPQKR